MVEYDTMCAICDQRIDDEDFEHGQVKEIYLEGNMFQLDRYEYYHKSCWDET